MEITVELNGQFEKFIQNCQIVGIGWIMDTG